MERIEYRDVIDKSGWPRGAWDNEPDKLQWPDEATGLACLAVRGPGGHWCGYVGVPEEHPLHGLDYGQCPQGEKCPDRTGERSWCDHSPESSLEAHGGITFAGGCAEIDETKWQEACKLLSARADEAKKYPQGDSAQAIKEWSPIINNYDAWAARQRARNVCHLPAPGEPDHVWWFGFDCAHAGDLSPSYERLYRSARDDQYRDLPYVQEQCRNLARQLADRTQSSAQ